jgi:tetratricopeptide (TPR) repeat protein
LTGPETSGFDAGTSVARHLDQAIDLQRQGKPGEAEALYRRILEIDPDHGDALNNLGILLRRQDRLNESVEVLRHATRNHPDFPSAFNSLGMSLARAGQFDDALTALRQALVIDPGFAIARLNIAHTLEQSGDLTGAIDALGDYLAQKPDDADALNRLGCYQSAAGQMTEALRNLTRAVELAPDSSDASINLAVLLEDLGQDKEAIGLRRRVVDLASNDAENLMNLARLSSDTGQAEEALDWFDRALDLAPHMPLLHFNKGLHLLREGDFNGGWPEHEWRLKFASLADLFPGQPQPVWDGGDLTGKTIFLHGEQGWGDTIQCARYIPLVAGKAAKVILGVREPLARLFQDLPGVDQIITDPRGLPDFDLRCSLLSLPFHFGTDLSNIPDASGLLQPSGKFPLPPGDTEVRTGLVWGGSPTHTNDRNRSLPLDMLTALLDVPGFAFHSLQVDQDRRNEIVTSGLAGRLADIGGNLTDLADTADVISQLDLVITVDTAVAHLAGTLGKPVWIMLPFAADWRWLRNRDDSPWYPTARLFRQREKGNWPEVVQRLKTALADFVKPA